VGSYSHEKTHSLQEGQLDGSSVGDVGNLLPGITIAQDVHSSEIATTQEVRLASDPAPGRFIDYTVGAYYSWVDNGAPVATPGPLLPGAFGLVPGIDLAAFNGAYQVPVLINAPNTAQETSLFGSITFHLGDNTELSGGIRHIWSIYTSNVSISTGDGLINLGAIGIPSAPCSLLGALPGPNPGDCLLQSAAVVSNLATRYASTPNIYNVSLSHHFTRNFLAYATTGTAFRPPVASPGIQGALANSPNPDLSTLTFHPAETSRAYEVGIKSTWLDDRVRFNAAIFRQSFNNMTLYVPNIYYINTVSGAPSSFSFTQSVNARVQGFDLDTAFQVTPEWTVSAQMSYADGKVQGSLVPCNIYDASGAPIFNTEGLVSLCPGKAASTLPLWNATFQSEYNHPVNDDLDGFLRVLATYYPENKNRAEPNFTVPNYSLVNLYLDVRSHDGAWEASIFARNAFNTQVATDISSTPADLTAVLSTAFSSLIHPSGYNQTKMTPMREVGVNVHYAFGSR
jgi:iron complex outermembrane receptor protein